MNSFRLAIAGVLTDLVGASVGNRIRPGFLPEKPVYPSITYEIVSSIPQRDLEGWTGIIEARVEVSVWHHVLAATEPIMDAIRRGLQALSGPAHGIAFDYVIVDDLVRTYEALQVGSDQGVYQVAVDFLIGHQDAA